MLGWDGVKAARAERSGNAYGEHTGPRKALEKRRRSPDRLTASPGQRVAIEAAGFTISYCL